jgi:serine/threonine-protein kinase
MPLRDQLQASLGDAYVLEQELGGGGMSRVFVAEDRALGRKVVVKVLSPELAAGVSSERFSREIRVAAGLQQANIVPLHAAGETCGLPYYTMPFVEGQSLRQRLTVSGPLSIGEAINVLRDVARALAYAHEHGVIHRDIKPENVLLSGDAAVVTDFGIAKALSAARGERAAPAEQEDNRDPTALTVAGAAIGTPAYMAPEQALGDPDTDHRADVYSFGCLAYELLTGNTPFHGRSMQQVLVAHVQEQAPDVAAARKDAPPALVGLVSRCLKKDPRERPQSAREILGALDAVATPGPGLFAPVAAPARRRWSGRAIVFGLAAAAVVGVAAVVVRGRWMTGASEPRALAVMPFTNVGGDSTQQYFADGIAIDLTNALTKVSGLRVTSRSLAFTYQGKAVDVRTVGKELNVDAVVEGTVQRSGTGLRVTSQLTRTSDGVTTAKRRTYSACRTQSRTRSSASCASPWRGRAAAPSGRWRGRGISTRTTRTCAASTCSTIAARASRSRSTISTTRSRRTADSHAHMGS